MKTFQVTARDIPDAWFQLVDLCYNEGRDYRVGEGSYAGSQFRRELDYATIHIRYPQHHPMLPEIPKDLGLPDPVPEGMDYIARYLPYLMTPHIEPNEQYTYGQRLVGCTPSTDQTEHTANTVHDLIVNNEDVPFEALKQSVEIAHQAMPSQVDEVIEKLKRGFASNQACMTIAQPSDIHLTDPPCLRQIDCRIYEEGPDANKLHFMIYFRSWDLWGGFPANLAAIAHLQEHMALEIGVEPGEFICASKGIHLYDMYWPLAKARLHL